MRRTIERITWYKKPDDIYRELILSPGWDYAYNQSYYKIRDMAFITVLYLAAARVTEITGGNVLLDSKEKVLDPVTKDQFFEDDNALWLRQLPIIKQKWVKRGSRWVPILEPRDYPERVEIPFYKDEKPFDKFTNILMDHLETVGSKAPVFNFGRKRAYQIVCEYGEFPHYYRDMGLKFWRRYFKNNSFKLKKFSGHKKWSSLEKYMGEELYS